MQTHIVVGLGFGDEGKGLVTSSLVASLKNPLVIRFNGGHQAGHTVVKEVDSITDKAGNKATIRHVFSNFGSGTLRGAPTYWSKYCTFDPVGVYNEYKVLQSLGIEPVLYVDPECPVVTGYDKHANMMDTTNGTCGVGFGTTLQREQDHYHFLVRDMFYPKVLRQKLSKIHSYYGSAEGSFAIETEMACNALIEENIFQVRQLKAWTNAYSDIVFEGAQGIMLDQEFGFFPNVTRSNTSTRNAREIINQCLWDEPTVYYVTRAYQTRHGNGYMSNEDKPIKLKNNENETNKSDGIQGKFRTGVLDLDLLSYALECDKHVAVPENKRLAITCLDQVMDEKYKTIPFSIDNNGYTSTATTEWIASALKFNPDHELILFNSPITRKLF